MLAAACQARCEPVLLPSAQGLDRALEEGQAQLAARASSVAAREAACAASERQLAARLAQFSLHERALQERTARVAALEHDVQARSTHCGAANFFLADWMSVIHADGICILQARRLQHGSGKPFPD